MGPDGVETFGLIRSVERREKERAMHDRSSRRIEDRLARLERRLQRTRRPLDVRRLERQVGRLLERSRRAAGRYVIDFVPDPARAGGGRLEWTARPQWGDWARWSKGCYVLRTNVADWRADDLWRTYIQLTDAEAALRIQKSELGIRPAWHQRADRVQAHILRRIQSTDVVLPAADGRELRLRCIVRPDAQAALLDRLGLDLPQRLRVPAAVDQLTSV